MATDSISAIATAIAEGFKTLRDFMSGKEIRRLRYQIEAAQNYIFVDEESGQYAGINEKEKRDHKIHFRKQVFDSA